MKSEAVAKGDQPYGAVLVRDGAIIGYGPSRVITDRNPDAHAERVALWDAQRRSGSRELAGAVIYSRRVPAPPASRRWHSPRWSACTSVLRQRTPGVLNGGR